MTKLNSSLVMITYIEHTERYLESLLPSHSPRLPQIATIRKLGRSKVKSFQSVVHLVAIYVGLERSVDLEA